MNIKIMNVTRNENQKSLYLQIKMAHCAKQGKQAVDLPGLLYRNTYVYLEKAITLY